MVIEAIFGLVGVGVGVVAGLWGRRPGRLQVSVAHRAGRSVQRARGLPAWVSDVTVRNQDDVVVAVFRGPTLATRS